MDAPMREGTLGLAAVEETEPDYNPLEYIEGIDEDDWEDDDRLILPDPIPPTEEPRPKQAAVFSPERAGSVENAVTELVKTNAARRHILLSIIDWARGGITAQNLFDKITVEHADNLSVYEPVSYCRMLERAGALEFVQSDSGAQGRDADEQNSPSTDVGDEIGFMSIEEKSDPLWRSTEGGLSAFEQLTRGDEWREIILGEDAIYAEVYLAVMQLLHEGSKTKAQICDIAEAFDVTRSPRKWGAYFIDVLEATSAIRWTNSEWALTDLGEELLDELAAYCAESN